MTDEEQVELYVSILEGFKAGAKASMMPIYTMPREKHDKAYWEAYTRAISAQRKTTEELMKKYRDE